MLLGECERSHLSTQRVLLSQTFPCYHLRPSYNCHTVTFRELPLPLFEDVPHGTLGGVTTAGNASGETDVDCNWHLCWPEFLRHIQKREERLDLWYWKPTIRAAQVPFLTHLSLFIAVPRTPANSSSLQNEQSPALRKWTTSECRGHLLSSWDCPGRTAQRLLGLFKTPFGSSATQTQAL